MLNSYKITVLMLLCCFLTSNINLYAQEIKVVRDFGVWMGLSTKKNVLSDFNLTLEHQIRTFNNSSKLDDYLFDARLKYDINKKFGLTGGLRYVHNTKRIESTENNIRLNLDIEYQKKIAKKTQIKYRLRAQQEFVNAYLFFFRNGQQKVTSSSIRNKLKISFKGPKKIKLYSSIEVFRLIEVFREPYFNKFRLVIGNEINNKIDVSIGIEKELSSNHPYSFWFLKTIYKLKR